jgi:hypothetical protein
MQITHEKARHLIQFALDGRIDLRQKQLLDSHLAACTNCKQYADSLQDLEYLLRPLLQRQWDRQPVPLSTSVITSKAFSHTLDRMLLATRIAAVGLVFAVFLFSAWQLTFSKPPFSSPAAASVPQIPIPSTSTELALVTQTQTCEPTVYIVREKDSLAMLADRFDSSKEEIMAANHLKTDAVRTGMQLLIPTCQSTPTANISTTTFTPILSTITSTPGG